MCHGPSHKGLQRLAENYNSVSVLEKDEKFNRSLYVEVRVVGGLVKFKNYFLTNILFLQRYA